MRKINIDGREYTVPDDWSVIKACDHYGIEIPRFCYHESLEVAGNCRMCLVHVEKAPRPMPSCSLNVADGMVIKTNTPEIRQARQGVMEFLLINHPLDCPVCDKGGECELQDQALYYGHDCSRYDQTAKRAVLDKNMGPLIETHMTRCIHCTRCVRFLEDVAGTTELGSIGRGEELEIATYLQNAITSEVSGNIIDLCPVGALNSKPYAYTARPWELNHTFSIDVHDAMGSNIRIDSRGDRVMRILPAINKDINDEWLADKSRFAYDGLHLQRLSQPLMRVKGKLAPSSWSAAYDVIRHALSKYNASEIGCIAGDLVDVESMFAAKLFLDQLQAYNYDCRQDGSILGSGKRSDYLLNIGIKRIEEATSFLLIGTNPRYEAPLLNLRIRQAVTRNKANVALIGKALDLNYPYHHLGSDIAILRDIADGKHSYSAVIANSTRPVLLLGSGSTHGPLASAILQYTQQISNNLTQVHSTDNSWQPYNILHHSASRVGGLDIGFIPKEQGVDISHILRSAKVLFLLGADEIDLRLVSPDTTVIYLGHHGDRSAQRADIVLPTPAYTEKSGIYVNLEGTVQNTNAAVSPMGEAKTEWAIFRELSALLALDMPYDNDLASIRALLAHTYPVFTNAVHSMGLDIRTVDQSRLGSDLTTRVSFNKIGSENDAKMAINAELSGALPDYPVQDFYLSNSIARNSPLMAQCSVLAYKSSDQLML